MGRLGVRISFWCAPGGRVVAPWFLGVADVSIFHCRATTFRRADGRQPGFCAAGMPVSAGVQRYVAVLPAAEPVADPAAVSAEPQPRDAEPESRPSRG